MYQPSTPAQRGLHDGRGEDALEHVQSNGNYGALSARGFSLSEHRRASPRRFLVLMTQTLFDLTTPTGRREAETDLMWTDHGFLRAIYQNFHWIDADMARANQPPSPNTLRAMPRWGSRPSSICAARARRAISRSSARRARHMVWPWSTRQWARARRRRRRKSTGPRRSSRQSAYPALMHCKSGADRARIMAVLYLHFHRGMDIASAMSQLSLKYLHVKQGKTGMLDFFFRPISTMHAPRPCRSCNGSTKSMIRRR